MPNPVRIQITCEPMRMEYPIAAGSPFVLAIEAPDREDWTGIELACDVRDSEDNLLFRVTSEDAEIVVDDTNTQLIEMTWPAIKTAELADYTTYKFDIIEVETKAIVWPMTQFTTIERVTE